MQLRLLFVVAALAGAANVKVTPIEKVTELLKGLQAKITEEGKKEAAAYDKYACFCKEQADGKLYSIETSTEKIGKLKAEISGLDADIASLNGDVSKLSQQVSGLEQKIKADEDARAKDHDKYLAKARDLSEAIDSCDAAISAMKDAKGGLADAKVNFVQVHAAATRLAVAPQTLRLLEQLVGHQKQAPAKFAFQGNDIIATLQDLLADFKKSKADMDQDEFDVNSMFEKERLGDANEKKFANEEKDEKSALAESKTEEVMDARESKDEETKDKAADQAFLDTLTSECENKASLFDQRSKTRSDELTAMTGAIEQLQEGVKNNEGANKKLVGLVQSPLSPALIQRSRQIRTLQQNSNEAVKRVEELLQKAAEGLDSSVLRAAAARVAVSADHFVKVRGLIKDLISKLKADATAEADQKSFCDKAMKKAVTSRDESKGQQEAAQAKLATLGAKKADLKADIADLGAKIAANKKALNEATELRNGEKTDNEATVASAEEGKAAVDMALNLLSSFYKNAFVQTASKYVPPKSDRDGNTVGDVAPAVFDESYHGAQGESKGIMGIMEVIASDFERTIKTVTSDEKTAQDEFDKLEKGNNDDTDAAGKTSDKKEGQLRDTEASILDQQQALKDATGLNDSSMEKLDDLKASCVEGEETWEERAAARKKEIEALKDAQNILDEWQA